MSLSHHRATLLNVPASATWAAYLNRLVQPRRTREAGKFESVYQTTQPGLPEA